ncbi:LuxR C-terminal-related transcriptional regulator [Actinomadura litoris]|uniref:LuxR C-terminal-related transcriptional regulator n=1 Tax=Actinomadura litoris TaxID=2678616 RepID=UPI0027E144A7|nr:LuxR C-terminal-related transcriptional regulator [Actinomadura litoris]
MLYGRNTEQARIAALLSEARDGRDAATGSGGGRRSGALVLRGEAGIGKSALLEDAADGVPRVLRAVGIEAESEIAFAGLNQLLWPVRDRVDTLPGPQARALRAALAGSGEHPGDPGSRDRFTTGLALLTLLADLAETDGPVPGGGTTPRNGLVPVGGTTTPHTPRNGPAPGGGTTPHTPRNGPLLCLLDDAQWFDVETAEALLFAARRLAAEGVVMLFAARDEAFAGTGLPELRLDRLDRDAAERLLSTRRLPPLTRARIVRESEGNPLALLEFGSVRFPVPDGARPLPVTDRVIAAFRDQIGGLPEPTRTMLLIAAAEGRGHMPSQLAAARALGVGLDDLEEAERARLIEVTGRTIVFRHPLIRAASYHGAVAAQRLAVHQALADAADDLDCRARHLASAAMAPDEGVASELQQAAERARGLCGYATAAALYRQAAELTPVPHARAVRLRSAAELTLQAGQPDEAESLAADAEKFTADTAEHARLGRVRASVEFERGDPATAARMMVEHAEHAAPDDRAEMLRTGATYAWRSGEAPAVLRAARLLPADRTIQGLAYLVEGDVERGLPVLAALVTQARAAEPAGRLQAARLALIVGDDAAALDLTTAETAFSRGHGLIGSLPDVLRTQAQARIAAGLHGDAEHSVAEAVALARDIGLPVREGRFRAVLARIPAIEGDEARLTELMDGTPQSGLTGLLHLGLGRYDDALRHLEGAAHGPRRYSAGVMVSSADLVETAVRSGDPDRARPAFDRFRAWAHAGGQPWALAVASRCKALLDDAEEHYTQAISLHEQSTRPFERARTELLYGEWLRRARRRSDARHPLRSAVEIFERLHATPWLDRARVELRATGVPGDASVPTAPDLFDRLTPQELQVVRLAAEGTSSRDIAAQLFLSPRTVEYHLYKAYPKLGVSSRKELSRLTLEPAHS